MLAKKRLPSLKLSNEPLYNKPRKKNPLQQYKDRKDLACSMYVFTVHFFFFKKKVKPIKTEKFKRCVLLDLPLKLDGKKKKEEKLIMLSLDPSQNTSDRLHHCQNRVRLRHQVLSDTTRVTLYTRQ